MSAQQRQNPVLRVDDRAEHPVPLLKADELNQPASLVVDSPLQGKRRGGVRVASICAARGPCAKQSRTNRSSVRSLPGSVQRKPVVTRSFTSRPAGPALRDPPRVLLVGKNLPRAEEIQLSLLGRADLGGDLLPGVASNTQHKKPAKLPS